jgi:hypothetical protein
MKRSLMIVSAVLATFGGTAHSLQAESFHQVTVYDSGRSETQLYSKVQYRPVAPGRSGSSARVVYASNVSYSQRAIRTFASDVPVGSTITAKVNFLGKEQGFVLMKMGNAILDCQITDWSANNVSFEIPDMGLSESILAELQIIRPSGDVVKSYSIRLVSKPELVVDVNLTPSPAAGSVAARPLANTHGLIVTSPNAPEATLASDGAPGTN